MESYVGRTFGRLTVIEETDPITDSTGKTRTAYNCRCSCGKELVVSRHALQSKTGTKSCGCLNAENRSKLGLSKRKHHPLIATAKMLYQNRYSDGDISFDKFMELSQMNCHYCNSKPNTSYNKFIHRQESKVSDYAKEHGKFTYNGLDRIDSSKGHTIDNVVPCCIVCNRAKTDHSETFFREWIIKVYDNWAKKTGG